MSIERQHPLTEFLGEPRADVEQAQVQIAVLPFRQHLNLRGDPANDAFVRGCEDALGQSLPRVANRFSRDRHTVFWLGPAQAGPSSPSSGAGGESGRWNCASLSRPSTCSAWSVIHPNHTMSPDRRSRPLETGRTRLPRRCVSPTITDRPSLNPSISS